MGTMTFMYNAGKQINMKYRCHLRTDVTCFCNIYSLSDKS